MSMFTKQHRWVKNRNPYYHLNLYYSNNSSSQFDAIFSRGAHHRLTTTTIVYRPSVVPRRRHAAVLSGAHHHLPSLPVQNSRYVAPCTSLLFNFTFFTSFFVAQEVSTQDTHTQTPTVAGMLGSQQVNDSIRNG